MAGFGARSRAKEIALRSAPAPAPKVRDTHDERAEKAEKIALAQHGTSLLSKEPSAQRAGPTVSRGVATTARGVEKESGAMPFALQIVGVMALAGAVAFGVSIFAPELMYSVL